MPNSNAIRFLRPLDAPPSRTGGCRNKPLCLKLRGDFSPWPEIAPKLQTQWFIAAPARARGRRIERTEEADGVRIRHVSRVSTHGRDDRRTGVRDLVRAGRRRRTLGP